MQKVFITFLSFVTAATACLALAGAAVAMFSDTYTPMAVAAKGAPHVVDSGALTKVGERT